MLENLRARLSLALLPKEAKASLNNVRDGSPLAGLFTSRAPAKLGTAELLNAYGQMPWLRAVVNKVGQAVGTTNWRLYVARKNGQKAVRRTKMQRASLKYRKELVLKEMEKGDLEEIEDHPLLDLLANGNPALNGEGVFQTSQIHLDLVGEAFWILERNNAGMPVGLWPIPPNWVVSLPTVDSPYFKVQFGSRQADVPITEVIFFKDPDPANPYERGTGVAKSLGDELEIDDYAAKHMKNFFFNRARPDVIIHGDGLQRSDTARMQEDWLQKHQGFWNAWKPHFINRKVEVTELGGTMENMQMVDIRKSERDAVLQVFGAPPEKFGVLTASNRCFDEQTQALTKQGWVDYTELDGSSEIATWNHEKQCMEYQRPTHIHVSEYDGVMHHYKRRVMDQLVTPNHRMWVQTQFNGPFYFRESQDLAGVKVQSRMLATAGGYKTEGLEYATIPHIPNITHKTKASDGNVWKLPVETFAPFLGWFIAEGHAGDSEIRTFQLAGELADEIVLHTKNQKIGEVAVTSSTNSSGKTYKTIRVRNKSVCQWLKREVGSHSTNKKLPREVFEWKPEHQLELLKAMIDGDGHWKAGNRHKFTECYYATSSKQLADDVQQLCMQLGLRASINIKEASSREIMGRIHDCAEHYIVWIGQPRNYCFGSSGIKEVPYKGKVWCVTVPNGIFITRRNGKIGIQGNSTITSADFFWTKDIVLPRVEKMRNQLQQQLIPLFDDRLILDFESPIVEDAEHILNVMKANPGAFTKNEWREEAERESLGETGEVFMMRSGELERPLTAGPMTELPDTGSNAEPDSNSSEESNDSKSHSVQVKSIQKSELLDPKYLEGKIRKRISERLNDLRSR